MTPFMLRRVRNRRRHYHLYCVSLDRTCHPHGWLTNPKADLLRTAREWLASSWWTTEALQGQPQEHSQPMWHTIVQHRTTSKGQNYLADHVLWRSIALRGQACQLSEGEACSAQGGPTSQQWLPVCHVRSDVPVKDRTLCPYQNTSLVMRSVASTAQSREC